VPCRHDSPTKSGKCRGDTAGRSAGKSGGVLDGFLAKSETENDGKNGEKHQRNGNRARMATKCTLAFAAVGLK